MNKRPDQRPGTRPNLRLLRGPAEAVSTPQAFRPDPVGSVDVVDPVGLADVAGSVDTAQNPSRDTGRLLSDVEALSSPAPAPPGDTRWLLSDVEALSSPAPAPPGDTRWLLSDIEAVLLAAEEPIDLVLLAKIVDSDLAAVTTACAELETEYRTVGRGFEIAHVAGGIRLQTTAQTASVVQRFVTGSNSARLSAAAMETLAVVAYKQPVSRSQITAIRGVNTDAVVRSLCERGYLVEAGRDPGPGSAALLRTTDKFLVQLGIDSLGDLPSLADMELDADTIGHLGKLDGSDQADGSDGSGQVDESDGSDGSGQVDESDGSDGSGQVDESDGSDESGQVDESDGSDGSGQADRLPDMAADAVTP